MNNELYIEEQMDAWWEGRIDESTLGKMLSTLSPAEQDLEKNSYRAAVNAVIQWSSYQEVGTIHREFLPAFSTMSSVPETRVRKMTPWKAMIRVAAVLVLIAAGWLSVTYFKTNSGGLFTELYQPYEVNTERGWETVHIHEMLQSFQRKDYTEVTRIYHIIEAPDNRENFLAGYSFLQLKEPGKAESCLRNIIATNKTTEKSLYQDEAEYYLALSLLAQKKNKEAATLFTSISKTPYHTYYDRVNRWTITRLNWLR